MLAGVKRTYKRLAVVTALVLFTVCLADVGYHAFRKRSPTTASLQVNKDVLHSVPDGRTVALTGTSDEIANESRFSRKHKKGRSRRAQKLRRNRRPGKSHRRRNRRNRRRGTSKKRGKSHRISRRRFQGKRKPLRRSKRKTFQKSTRGGRRHRRRSLRRRAKSHKKFRGKSPLKLRRGRRSRRHRGIKRRFRKKFGKSGGTGAVRRRHRRRPHSGKRSRKTKLRGVFGGRKRRGHRRFRKTRSQRKHGNINQLKKFKNLRKHGLLGPRHRPRKFRKSGLRKQSGLPRKNQASKSGKPIHRRKFSKFSSGRPHVLQKGAVKHGKLRPISVYGRRMPGMCNCKMWRRGHGDCYFFLPGSSKYCSRRHCTRKYVCVGHNTGIKCIRRQIQRRVVPTSANMCKVVKVYGYMYVPYTAYQGKR